MLTCALLVDNTLINCKGLSKEGQKKKQAGKQTITGTIGWQQDY